MYFQGIERVKRGFKKGGGDKIIIGKKDYLKKIIKGLWSNTTDYLNIILPQVNQGF